MERGKGIEPSALAWKARVLPLYEPRMFGGVYWDRTSRAVGAGFTVQCITIDASTPCSATYSLITSRHVAQGQRGELVKSVTGECLGVSFRPTLRRIVILEESVRFELTDLLQPLVFKTSAIDHSANLPLLVRLARIELARLASRDFKSLASTYFTTVALLFGAQGETRTHKIWLLRPTRIPIPSHPHILSIYGAQGETRTLRILILNQARIPIPSQAHSFGTHRWN